MKNLLSLTFVVSVVVAGTWTVQASQSDDQPKQKPDAKADEQVDSSEISESAARAQATLKTARGKLIDHKSVRAQIIETVMIGNRRFRATGKYLQGTDLRLRLEYQIQVGSTKGYLLQVCDGEILWTHQTVGKLATVTRRNVREILNAAASSGDIPQNLLVAELGLGGLPALLASLERTMDFDTEKEETIDGNVFIVIEGTWKSKFSKHWADTNRQNPGIIPEYVPDRVRIFLDQKNLFPHRILYLKKPASKKVFRPMVALDFTKVVLNAATNPEEFSFASPKGVQEQDITQYYLQRLTAPKASEAKEASPSAQTPDKSTETPKSDK